MTRIAEPQLGFADLELRNQGVHLDPVLQSIVGFLDDHATLVEQVRQDRVWLSYWTLTSSCANSLP